MPTNPQTDEGLVEEALVCGKRLSPLDAAMVKDLAAEITRLRAKLAERTEALIEMVAAVDQMLDDMGETGLCVCEQAKEWAIATRAMAAAVFKGELYT